MKFIDTGDCARINVNQVKFFYPDNSGRVFAVFDVITNRNGEVAGYFERLLFRCGSKEAAQKYLAELDAKLNAGKTNVDD